MRWLLTGGAGFIGSNLAKRLLAGGHQVDVIDNLSTGRRENLSEPVLPPAPPGVFDSRLFFVEGDVRDKPLLAQLMKRCDKVVHLAATVGVKNVMDDQLQTLQNNVQGTESVLAAAWEYGQRPVLLLSTSEVYGNGEPLFHEDADLVLGSPAKGRWSYAISKLIDEAYGLAYYKRGLDVRIARLFNTVGPGQSAAYGMVIPRFVQQALSGKPLTVYGDGSQTRCFVHVKDVVTGLIRFVEGFQPDTGSVVTPADLAGKTINFGGVHEVSILDLANRIVLKTGSPGSIQKVAPYGGDPGFEDMVRRAPDIGRAIRWLGWTPTMTIDEILDDVIAYERGRLPK